MASRVRILERFVPVALADLERDGKWVPLCYTLQEVTRALKYVGNAEPPLIKLSSTNYLLQSGTFGYPIASTYVVE